MKKSVSKAHPIKLRILSYSVFTFAMIAWMTLTANLIIFFIIALHYQQYRPAYITGEEVMEELTQNEQGYVLSDRMQWQLEEKGSGPCFWTERER